jgi:hypothetical protein
MLFYSSMSWYSSSCYYILSLCYYIFLFYCAVHCYVFFCVLFLVMYVYLTVHIVLLTLPPGVNPIAVNKYQSIYLSNSSYGRNALSSWIREMELNDNSFPLILILDFHCGTNIVFFLDLGFLHGVRGDFTDDVSGTAVSPIFIGHDSWLVKMGPTAVSETSSVNSPRTPCKNPKTKKNPLVYSQ